MECARPTVEVGGIDTWPLDVLQLLAVAILLGLLAKPRRQLTGLVGLQH